LKKEDKTYHFWPLLAARMLYQRDTDEERWSRKVPTSSSNPKRIAPNIAMRPTPSTDELALKSRFIKK